MNREKRSILRGLGPFLTLGYLVFCLGLASCSQEGTQATGFIEGKEYLVRAAFPGKLQKVLVQEGQIVQKGQALAELDSESLRTALKNAEAQLAVVDAELERIQSLGKRYPSKSKGSGYYARVKRLYDAGGISRAQLSRARRATQGGYRGSQVQILTEEIEAKKKKAEARMEELESLAQTALLKAPAAGRVTRIYLKEEEGFSEGAPVFLITNAQTLFLVTSLPQTQLAQVKVGEKVTVKILGLSQPSFEGELTWIAPDPDPKPVSVQASEAFPRQTFGIKIKIPNPGGELKPGMEAVAKFQDKKS